MLEGFILQYVNLLAQPVIYGLVLFVLIITQIFAVLYNTIVITGARVMPSGWFFIMTITSTLIAESVAYYLGWKYRKFFRKKFPKVISIIDTYTLFGTFLIARFVGIPLLSYAIGVGHKFNFRKFFIGTVFFVSLNTLVMYWLGQSFTPKQLVFIILGLIILSWFEGLVEKHYRHR